MDEQVGGESPASTKHFEIIADLVIDFLVIGFEEHSACRSSW